VVVVCLWLTDQGLASLTTVDSSVGSLGLLTGLLSANLMLLQVLMLARIPWVERAWGHDLLTRRHRWVGFASFWLMLAHVLAYMAQRAGRSGASAQAWWRAWAQAWMLWATVGTLMIIAVVVTSIRAARRRLRYEPWHLLHLYAYLGVALALPHQLADGADFHGTGTRVYWWTLYLGTLAATLVFRIGLPLWRSARYRLRVASVRVERPGVVSVVIEGNRLDRLRTRSGQFFIWRFRDGPGWTRGNPYTISAAPRAGQLRVTVQVAGDGTARATRLRPGTRVYIEGPYGTMTAQRRRHPRMLLLAAGIGITPIRALLEDTAYPPGGATLVYRYSTVEDAVFRAEIDGLAAQRGVDVHYLPGARRQDGSWQSGVGESEAAASDAQALAALVPDIARTDIFVCGPPRWIRAVRVAAQRAGVERRDVHAEDFAW
jgi:predicted ferric reductase